MNNYKSQTFGQKELKPAEKIGDVTNYGLWHLGRRDHSTHEIRVKLGRKTDNPDWIEEAINQLKNWGYLDELRFVENFLTNCNEVKHYGPMRIIQEFRMKGADNDIVKQVMNESEFDYFESALKCLNNKCRQPIKDRNERDRLTRFLSSRGFTFDMIRYAFEDHLKNQED